MQEKEFFEGILYLMVFSIKYPFGSFKFFIQCFNHIKIKIFFDNFQFLMKKIIKIRRIIGYRGIKRKKRFISFCLNKKKPLFLFLASITLLPTLYRYYHQKAYHDPQPTPHP
jgi:hypothetical protein